MGLRLGFSRCKTNYSRSGPDCSCTPQVTVNPVVQISAPNPDPSRYTIISSYQTNGYLVMLVRYPDATNFEGRKILVYRHAGTPVELLERTKGDLDPHFCQDGTGPIARFEPTEEGARLAQLLVEVA